MDFNDKHPELQEGEMLILNEQENSNALVTFASLTYKTKRYGEVAYDCNGNVLQNTKPVFIKTKELKSRMKKNRID